MANNETPSPFAVRKIKWEGLKITIQLLRYLHPYRMMFAAGMLFLVLSTSTSLAFPKLVGSIIEVIEGKSQFTINQITLLLFVVLLGQAVFSYFRIYLFSKISEISARPGDGAR